MAAIPAVAHAMHDVSRWRQVCGLEGCGAGRYPSSLRRTSPVASAAGFGPALVAGPCTFGVLTSCLVLQRAQTHRTEVRAADLQ